MPRTFVGYDPKHASNCGGEANKSVRTYSDAYRALTRGYIVELKVTSNGSYQYLELNPWEYGLKTSLDEVRDKIEVFREKHKPYKNVEWTKKSLDGFQVQLKETYNDMPVGATGILDREGGASPFVNDIDEHVSVKLHKGCKYHSIGEKWTNLWLKWKVVDNSTRNLMSSNWQLGDVTNWGLVLERARSGDLMAAACWDYMAFMERKPAWWMMTPERYRSLPEYKSWERARFQARLLQIF